MINYYLLTKPGIILGNLLTMAAGFLLASRGQLYFGLFLATFLGLACIIASACILNNYIDRHLDRKMERTKGRALVTGKISDRNALMLAGLLCIVGNVLLLLFTNFLAFMIANVGFLVYVLLYSLWKGKTIYGTAIGSIAGAVPPVVGYCAASNRLDAGALILFAMLVLWQMPHFFAIAMYNLDDYVAAGIPVLPAMKGLTRTKIHMLIYILGFILVSMLLPLYHYTSYLYAIAAGGLGLVWLGLCLQGFAAHSKVWEKKMVRLSIAVIIVISLVIPLQF
jgi:protoheme IX farnesyltransferase